jgi:hypothetical protein
LIIRVRFALSSERLSTPEKLSSAQIARRTNRCRRFVSKDKIEVVQDFTTNKNSLNNALDNLFVEGGQTAIIDAIYRTAKKVDEYQKSQKRKMLNCVR